MALLLGQTQPCNAGHELAEIGEFAAAVGGSKESNAKATVKNGVKVRLEILLVLRESQSL